VNVGQGQCFAAGKVTVGLSYAHQPCVVYHGFYELITGDEPRMHSCKKHGSLLTSTFYTETGKRTS